MTGVFDLYAEKYDAWYENNRYAYLSELAALKKAVPRSGDGLEIGVGTGRFACVLGIGRGLDPSAAMLKIARSRGVNVRKGQGEKLPFDSFSFDYAAVIITLCFVKNPYQVLAEAGRVLKENGKIIIGIVDKDSLLGKLYRSKKSVFYKQANFLGVRGISAMLESLNFGRLRYYQTIFSLPESMRRVHKVLPGFGKGGFVVIAARKSK